MKTKGCPAHTHGKTGELEYTVSWGPDAQEVAEAAGDTDLVVTVAKIKLAGVGVVIRCNVF